MAEAVALPELLTAEEVASRLRLGLSTIYGLARSGELPSAQPRWQRRTREVPEK